MPRAPNPGISWGETFRELIKISGNRCTGSVNIFNDRIITYKSNVQSKIKISPGDASNSPEKVTLPFKFTKNKSKFKFSDYVRIADKRLIFSKDNTLGIENF